MPYLIDLLRIGAGLLAFGAGGAAVLAFFGFSDARLDLLNHFQVFIFAGTLMALLLALVSFRGNRWRGIVTAVAAVGFLASAVAFLPETATGLLPRPAVPSDGRPLHKLMTHNIFGLNYDMALVDEVIRKEDPDIIAFQELFGAQFDALNPLLTGSYPYETRCDRGNRSSIAIYAKRPFVAKAEGACVSGASGELRTGRLIATFTDDDGKSFSVMTTHLDWPAPIIRQEREFADLSAALASFEGPLVLVGDFNSTPWSYALRRFAAETGFDRQTRNLVTFPLRFTLGGLVDTMPFLPLDHVMTRGGITVHDVHAAGETGSDHLPVVATFSLE